MGRRTNGNRHERKRAHQIKEGGLTRSRSNRYSKRITSRKRRSRKKQLLFRAANGIDHSHHMVPIDSWKEYWDTLESDWDIWELNRIFKEFGYMDHPWVNNYNSFRTNERHSTCPNLSPEEVRRLPDRFIVEWRKNEKGEHRGSYWWSQQNRVRTYVHFENLYDALYKISFDKKKSRFIESYLYEERGVTSSLGWDWFEKVPAKLPPHSLLREWLKNPKKVLVKGDHGTRYYPRGYNWTATKYGYAYARVVDIAHLVGKLGYNVFTTNEEELIPIEDR